MRIYIDVIFLVNFIMDSMILWIISILDRRKVAFKRIVAGGAVGAFLYCLLLFLPYLGSWINYVLGSFILGISVWITFRPKTLKVYIKLKVLSLLASVFVGGIFIAFFYFTKVNSTIPLAIGNFSIKVMLVLTIVIYAFIKWAGGMLISEFANRNGYCRISICFNGKKAEIMALMDTGNFLIEDQNGNKIIIAEFGAIKQFFSTDTQLLYYQKLSPQEILEGITDEHVKTRLQLIPFSSMGTDGGLLTAFKADFAEVFTEKKVVLKDALLVIYNGRLSTNFSCNGIINPSIIDI
ncbi:MAG: sigma-E processing peptidase SpoIIGA [Lachnospiraceae bacterium]|nr:sigma-E processing peptidase SpoIIGA [Lachnospiraceae bacterium]